MIRSFKHKGLKQLFEDGSAKLLQAEHVDKLENILAVLNRAQRPSDADIPGFRLHPLTGNLKGSWSITVQANWRVIFRFEAGDVYQVDLDNHDYR